MQTNLSYDDVLLRPKETSVRNLDNVDTSTEVGGIPLDIPVMSAAMDTVTEYEMAQAMADAGGIGVIHRFMPPSEQKEQVARVDGPVGAAVGLREEKRVEALLDVGCDMIVYDIAHGHHEMLAQEIRQRNHKDAVIVAGNVATKEGTRALADAGADVVKVGVGPGSACTTREMTGAGVPQFSAVKECAQVEDVDIIADGGIRKPGDMCKALMAGADAVMVGGKLSDKQEAAQEGLFRGMASREAAEDRADRTDRQMNSEDGIKEGETFRVTTQDGTVAEFMSEYKGALRSSISYCGGRKLEQAQRNAEFIRITESTKRRNGTHY